MLHLDQLCFAEGRFCVFKIHGRIKRFIAVKSDDSIAWNRDDESPIGWFGIFLEVAADYGLARQLEALDQYFHNSHKGVP